jgi:hypothetical protein
VKCFDEACSFYANVVELSIAREGVSNEGAKKRKTKARKRKLKRFADGSEFVVPPSGNNTRETRPEDGTTNFVHSQSALD